MQLHISHLKKVYSGRTVLDIPQLDIAEGELVGLVGNNGAGKTTLLRLALDLIRADEGTVESEGQRVDQSDAWKHYTGSFIDGRFLIDFYTPEEYFAFIAQAYGIPKDEMAARLERFKPLMHDEILGTRKYLRDFSQGNRQKVGIIGAMVIQPRVLLLDEPFNYLDPSSQIQVAHLLDQQCREHGTTTLISSHNLNFVTDISTRVLLLERGRLVRDLSNDGGAARQALESYFSAED